MNLFNSKYSTDLQSRITLSCQILLSLQIHPLPLYTCTHSQIFSTTTAPQMFTKIALAGRSSRRSQFGIIKRSLHDVPVLKKQPEFAQNGIAGLYSANGFKSAWSEYQKYLTTNLTLKTKGTQHETCTPFQIILLTSKNGLEQPIFHYASQAHNNHLFFELLTDKDAAAETVPSRFLMERLADENILTLQDLKDKIIEAANTLTGQGWVYLVERGDKSLKVIASNNDGTPYYFGRGASFDMNGAISESTYEQYEALKEQIKEGELDFTLPLLAINVWDVAFWADYGLNGKQEYLKNVVDCISWDVVNQRRFQI